MTVACAQHSTPGHGEVRHQVTNSLPHFCRAQVLEICCETSQRRSRNGRYNTSTVIDSTTRREPLANPTCSMSAHGSEVVALTTSHHDLHDPFVTELHLQHAHCLRGLLMPDLVLALDVQWFDVFPTRSRDVVILLIVALHGLGWHCCCWKSKNVAAAALRARRTAAAGRARRTSLLRRPVATTATQPISKRPHAP